MPRILIPFAGILLLASYACAGSQTLSTSIPAPNANFISMQAENLTLKPQATAPVCTDGKLYFDDATNEVKICNGGLPESPGPWTRNDATRTTSLKDIDDAVIIRGSQNLANITLEGSVAAIAGTANAPVSIPTGANVAAFLVDFTKSGAMAVGINGPFEDTLDDVGTASARLGGGTKALGAYSFVSGAVNTVDVNSSYSVIAGGQNNNITNSMHASVGGGQINTVSGNYSSVGGGFTNTVSGPHSFLGGGASNTVSGIQSVLGGGTDNTVSGATAVVGGGTGNLAEGITSFVGGGAGNQATGESSTIAGGVGNLVSGRYSFASGISNQVTGEASGAFGSGNIVNGDRSFAIGHQLGINNPDTTAFSGVVAIGHYDARASLDVNGEIILGLGTTARYAAGGPVPLVMRKAIFGADGVISTNYGITSVSPGDPKSTFIITFTDPVPFISLPVPNITIISRQPQLTGIVIDLTPSEATVAVYDPLAGDYYTGEDFSISFSVEGPVNAPGAL